MLRHQHVQLGYRALAEPYYLLLHRHLGLDLVLLPGYVELVSLGSIRIW